MSGEQILRFPRLDGGLNLRELDYRMDSDQSPYMKNLLWKNGVLSCRDGQVWLTEEMPGEGFAAYERPFRDAAVLHIGDGLYVLPREGGLVRLCGSVPGNPGDFVPFGESLLYKNRGGYFRIEHSDEGFTAAEVAPYTPVILINARPDTGSGDLYQSENRLSPHKTVWYTAVEGVTEYHLPVDQIRGIERVEVDGEETDEVTVDLEKGTVTFQNAPPCRAGEVNTVRITYTKPNEDALRGVMDCPRATAYGGDQNVCVVVGGGSVQPNAYFWSGHHAIVDPGYFPVEQYNLAGAAAEPITGFGKQQNMLVIFQENSVGRTVMGTAENDAGRVVITMDYTAINDRIGCDLPGTIQLIENHLVFANTRQGVHMLRDSSAANENNIACVSDNIGPGLLPKVRAERGACAFDDGERYWLVSGGEAYVWDYSISTPQKPSWFYLTNIRARALFRWGEELCHLNGEGRVTVFRPEFHDYGGAIEKVYQFATQSMGGYDRLKDITGVLFTVRSDTDTIVKIKYLTDYEERYDLTDIAACRWRAAPRNLAYRCLGVNRYAVVARRRPGCRHVRHFTMRLENNEVRSDLSIVTAEIYYRYRGRER